MSVNFDGSTDYYDDGSWGGPTAAPLSIAGWANTNTTSSGKGVVTVWVDDNNYFQLLMGFGGGILMTTSATSAQSATTAGTMGTNAWHHLAGVTANDSSRFAYLDGVESTENTGTRVPTAPDTIRLGANHTTTPGGIWNGELAHVGVWNRALSADEIAGLAQGWHPRFYSRGLVWLWEGFDVGEGDVYGSSLTENGTPIKSDEHPPVFFPYSRGTRLTSPAAPAGGASEPTPLRFVTRRRRIVWP